MDSSYYSVSTSEGGTMLLAQPADAEPPTGGTAISESEYTQALEQARQTSSDAVTALVQESQAAQQEQASADYQALVAVGLSDELAARLARYTP